MNNITINTEKHTEFKNGQRVTIKILAERLNLSPSAVSAILNKKKTCFASKETKERVFQVARELDYRPNRIARSLRTQKTDIIGVILTCLRVDTILNDIESIESLAWKQNYRLFIAHSKGDPEREEVLLREFYGTPVDGIIMVPTGLASENNFLKQLIAENFPIVTITPVENTEVGFVSTDYKKGGFLATEHLIGLGYKRIGFFAGSLKHYPLAERLKGYEEALIKHNMNLKSNPVFEREAVKFQEILAVAKKLLDTEDVPRAIFTGSDTYAIAFIRAALEKGFKIPQDFSVIGFDDSEMAPYSPVPLTTIRQPGTEISEKAFNLLMKKINNENIAEGKIILEPQLIVRQSTKKL